MTTIFMFLLSTLFIAITIVDMKTMTIPNKFIFALIPLAVASAFLFPEISLLSRMIGIFAVSLPMLFLTILLRNGFGGGDIKFVAICGFLLGWQYIFVAMSIAVILGGCASLCLFAGGKAKKGDHIAFAPYLCIGCFIAFLYGNQI